MFAGASKTAAPLGRFGTINEACYAAVWVAAVTLADPHLAR